ncbi:MAG TPA: hypothetical protein PK937_15590 [bacterium]|nr:hypothetical protein [bacterium]HNH34046.1 hypothetical protein [bacterium]
MSDPIEQGLGPSFKLTGFVIDSFSLENEARQVENVDADMLLYHHQGNAEIIPPKKLIRIKLSVTAEYEGKTLGKIVTQTEFEIINFEIFINNEILNIPGELMSMLVGLAYSTTRGALIAKSEGTILAKFPMPVVSPSRLIGIAPMPS